MRWKNKRVCLKNIEFTVKFIIETQKVQHSIYNLKFKTTIMNSKITSDIFPSFQKGGGDFLHTPTVILLPSPPPPFELESTFKNSFRTLTFDFRVISFDVRDKKF